MKKVLAIAGLVICILGYSLNQSHATVIEGYFSGSYIAMPYGEGVHSREVLRTPSLTITRLAEAVTFGWMFMGKTRPSPAVVHG